MYYFSKALVFIACLACVCTAHLHPEATNTLRVAAFSIFMLQGLFIKKSGGLKS